MTARGSIRQRQAIPLVLVACAVVSGGFAVYLGHAAGNIHQCNVMDREPCLSAFGFPFGVMKSIGIALSLILLCSAAIVPLQQIRRGDRSGRRANASVALVVLAVVVLAVAVVVSAERSQAIYSYNDPSQWMYTGVGAFVGFAVLPLAAMLTARTLRAGR
jgi:hypothetical protein